MALKTNCTQISSGCIAVTTSLGVIMLAAGAYTGGALFLVGTVIGIGFLLRSKLKSNSY